MSLNGSRRLITVPKYWPSVRQLDGLSAIGGNLIHDVEQLSEIKVLHVHRFSQSIDSRTWRKCAKDYGHKSVKFVRYWLNSFNTDVVCYSQSNTDGLVDLILNLGCSVMEALTIKTNGIIGPLTLPRHKRDKNIYIIPPLYRCTMTSEWPLDYSISKGWWVTRKMT